MVFLSISQSFDTLNCMFSFLRLRLDQLQASGNEFIAPTDVVESRFQSPVPTLEELAARALRLHKYVFPV